MDEGADNTVLGHKRDQTPLKGGPKAIAARMAEVLIESLEEAGLKTSDLAGVGVGSPGSVDDKKGTVSGAMNLSEWSGSFNLRKALEKELNAPVSLGNDVDLATDAEFQIGAAKDYRTLLGVFWGTGVGGGIVLDGRPWTGRSAAGEIGHVVVRIGGERCGCGRHGCMEAYAGRASMERRAREAQDKGEKTELFKIMEQRGRTRLASGVWDRALKRGDKLATRLIDEALDALGAGVASTQNVLDVEAIILGGGLGIRLGAPFAERLAKAMHPHLFDDVNPPAIHVAALGDLGGAIGAALLARR